MFQALPFFFTLLDDSVISFESIFALCFSDNLYVTALTPKKSLFSSDYIKYSESSLEIVLLVLNESGLVFMRLP